MPGPREMTQAELTAHRYGVIDVKVEPSAPPEDAGEEVAEEVTEVEETVAKETPAELTEEERQQQIEAYQREVMERVPTLQEECHLGKVTDFCRISDLHNKKFAAAGPSQREMQAQLVRFCGEACAAFEKQGKFDREQAQAVVYAFISAANNQLYPTEESEGFFGVEVPTIESLLQGCSLLDDKKPEELDAAERRAFEEATFGLLVWRTWKILIRTPEGRQVMLAELLRQCEKEEEKADMLQSYSAVEATLVECLLTNTVRSKFIEWVGELPVSHVMQNRCLMPREKKFLLDSLKTGEPVEWLKSRTTKAKAD